MLTGNPLPHTTKQQAEKTCHFQERGHFAKAPPVDLQEPKALPK